MSATMAAPVDTSLLSATGRSKMCDVSMSADLARVQGEYVEMPGLVLTLPQAARLWGLNAGRAAELLTLLVDAGFLAGDKGTGYRRRQ